MQNPQPQAIELQFEFQVTGSGFSSLRIDEWQFSWHISDTLAGMLLSRRTWQVIRQKTKAHSKTEGKEAQYDAGKVQTNHDFTSRYTTSS